ncbi:MerR family transcriptional regulator [Hamadaea sp. NPDC050747]|uniref:MerR family transcriptional regulator n=1 Tax=Hamadaea sp. NPDC050747 TaxID=3155789 RepID=UPI00340575DF
MIPAEPPVPTAAQLAGNLDDGDFPAYSMSAAAAMLGVQPAFLRGLGDNGLLDPARSDGGHRRYSRADLQIAARAREVVDAGMNLAAACRIVELEAELARTRAELAEARRTLRRLRGKTEG